MISALLSSVAGIGFASFLLFFRDKAKYQVVFVNSGFIAASFMYSQLHYSFGKCFHAYSISQSPEIVMF